MVFNWFLIYLCITYFFIFRDDNFNSSTSVITFQSQNIQIIDTATEEDLLKPHGQEWKVLNDGIVTNQKPNNYIYAQLNPPSLTKFVSRTQKILEIFFKKLCPGRDFSCVEEKCINHISSTFLVTNRYFSIFLFLKFMIIKFYYL